MTAGGDLRTGEAAIMADDGFITKLPRTAVGKLSQLVLYGEESAKAG